MTDTITFRVNQTLDNWRKRLAGEKIPTHEADPDVGFYRKRTKDITTNVVTWEPVAYFIADGRMFGSIGNRDMTENEIGDLWTFVCQYPIPEEVFFTADAAWAVSVESAADFEWPKGLLGEPKRPPFAVKVEPLKLVTPADWARRDREAAAAVPAANREVARTDNNAPPALDPVEEHRTGINNAIAAAPKAVPKTAEECALAEGSKNRIAELRLAADKAGKAIYEPLYRAYTAEQKNWSPMVAAATTAEKALATLVLTFKENERRRIAKEKADTDAAQAVIDAANARAADRAIAAGKPEPAPAVVEAPAPAAPAPVAPTYGKRTTKAEVKILLDDITDWQAVYSHFKDNDNVKALLRTLAAQAVAGGLTVPGTKTREGLI